jgi:hypothetical protein
VRSIRHVPGERGSALISALLMLTVMGFFLFGFETINQNELLFAGYSRNSTVAFNLAEAGAQEAVARLAMTGAPLGGTSSFTNSLAAATAGASGTVAYQASLASNGSIFPILSTATYSNATRKVRLLANIVFKPGFGDISSSASFNTPGSMFASTSDAYTISVAVLNSPASAPQCVSGTTATNLLSPQMLAGAWMQLGHGSFTSSYCTPTTYASGGTFTYECASGSLTEVAPTGCARATDGHAGETVPVNWHPMTPIGMDSTSFTTLVTWMAANPTTAASYGLSMAQATQNGTGVTYTSAGTYTPSYWHTIPSTNGKVELVVATQPVCIDTASNSASLPAGGTCSSGYVFIGCKANCANANATVRYLDWGLVQDDLSRAQATTFFQPGPTGCTGSACGLQNGIRYIPLFPFLWNDLAQFAQIACGDNIVGANVFDRAVADGVSCGSPTTTVSCTSCTFTGTQSSPESLVIDNGKTPYGTPQSRGTNVTIKPDAAHTPASSQLNCGANFANWSWGNIIASGDLTFNTNMIFTGFVYTTGSVSVPSGNVIFRGGVYAVNILGTTEDTDVTDPLQNCGGSDIPFALNPSFTSTRVLSWEDVPANQP